MRYRRFGRTELQMPVFSCGGMRYQHKWQDIAPDEVPKDGQANLEATILRALELGISHIETARGYGSSEMQLGWILPKLPREKMIVQTKVPPFAKPEDFLKTFNTSMKYLGLDYVDLLSFHGINHRGFADWTLRSITRFDPFSLITRSSFGRLYAAVCTPRLPSPLAKTSFTTRIGASAPSDGFLNAASIGRSFSSACN